MPTIDAQTNSMAFPTPWVWNLAGTIKTAPVPVLVFTWVAPLIGGGATTFNCRQWMN